MLVKGYEEVMKETPQQRLAREYAERTKNLNKIETTKPVEGTKKCQTKKTIKTKPKK
jgi:hypothetical protein